ncbi:uncharacterized protein LOC112157848 isoform X2 [Oryzias melastigma]|nr:uncharacterized protein LOC112157848 isoform X2 [Oryzias melastigma]XP_024146665.1 uncharacterized protein LOC112157848 isoform X2 [Oryzias melastigma]
MFVLLRKIRRVSQTAASVLQRADFCTDSEIRSLTREDLHELFPGAENLKLRRTIFRIIHKQKPLNLLLRELKCLISHNSLNAVPSKNGVLTDYLHVLRNLQTQLNHVQSFLEAHIGLLEDISKTHVDQEPEQGDLPESSSSAACTQPGLHPSQADVHPDQLTYQMIVSGRTWDAHLQLMAKVQAHLQDHVQLISCSQNGQIVFVFCHVGSHGRADVDAAMTDISDDVPVILVQMHHVQELNQPTPMTTWCFHSNIVLQINVFVHKEAHGLLRCPENSAAVSQILKKLLEFSKSTSAQRRTAAEEERGSYFESGGSDLDFKLFGGSGCSSSSSSSSSSSDSETKSIWESGP